MLDKQSIAAGPPPSLSVCVSVSDEQFRDKELVGVMLIQASIRGLSREESLRALAYVSERVDSLPAGAEELNCHNRFH